MFQPSDLHLKLSINFIKPNSISMNTSQILPYSVDSIYCKKQFGPISSQNMDNPALRGYSWISIRRVSIHIETRRKSRNIRIFKTSPNIQFFCAYYNGINRLKKAKIIQIYLVIYPVISGKSKSIEILIVLDIDPTGSG